MSVVMLHVPVTLSLRPPLHQDGWGVTRGETPGHRCKFFPHPHLTFSFAHTHTHARSVSAHQGTLVGWRGSKSLLLVRMGLQILMTQPFRSHLLQPLANIQSYNALASAQCLFSACPCLSQHLWSLSSGSLRLLSFSCLYLHFPSQFLTCSPVWLHIL